MEPYFHAISVACPRIDISFKIEPFPKFYLIKEFKRLKTEQVTELDWSIKRHLTKINYRIHTDAFKENLIPATLDKKQISHIYASGADILNMALFGKTAKSDSHSTDEDTCGR